jgi:hypothetical protein
MGIDIYLAYPQKHLYCITTTFMVKNVHYDLALGYCFI